MNEKLKLLHPTPQQIRVFEGNRVISSKILIFLPNSLHNMLPIARKIEKKMKACGAVTEVVASLHGFPKGELINVITLRINQAIFRHSEGYKIVIDDSGIKILGADKAGLFYGVTTFIQVIDLCGQKTNKKELIFPYLTIVDWPDYSNRGVMIDISRDKVPKMETLYDLVDLLSSWKINQVQLYTEHTFAYYGHEKVWEDASPFTGEEIISLNRFCNERFIQLVPNQNSFGHFHRWLIHDPYREFAECPDGFVNPFSFSIEPFSLCPTDPRSLELLDDLYSQLLPNFSSQQFNVGLDETFDLGVGRSEKLCSEKGKGVVYLEFLLKIYSLVTRKYDKVMQFWADIVFEHPELIPQLPKDVIALIWGYEEDHPFNDQCQTMKDTCLAYYVCPGTSSWNSIAGRTDNAIGNLRNAAINGKKNNAIGYLITDWGDHGHLQPISVSFLGFLVGAALSWNGNSDLGNIPSLLDVHVFHDRSKVMGKLVYDLGNAYQKIGFTIHNNSVLFLILLFSAYSIPKIIKKENSENLDITRQYFNEIFGQLSTENLEITRQYIEEVTKPLKTVKLQRKDGKLIIKEFQWITDILIFACNLGIALLNAGIEAPMGTIPPKTREALSTTLQQLINRHHEIWLLRNRRGGLEDSSSRLKRILAFLENNQ